MEIEIPLGINDGDNVQYQRLGPGGMDLIVEFRVKPNHEWRRQELSLMCERTVSVWNLICGTKLDIIDITGNHIEAIVPPMTQPGTVLRLRSRGLKNRAGETGDVLIKLDARIPNQIDPTLLSLIRQTVSKDGHT